MKTVKLLLLRNEICPSWFLWLLQPCQCETIFSLHALGFSALLCFYLLFFCFSLWFKEVDFWSFSPPCRIGSLCTHIAHFTKPTCPDTVRQNNKDAWRKVILFLGTFNPIFRSWDWTNFHNCDTVFFPWKLGVGLVPVLMQVTSGEGRFRCFYFDIFLKWRVLTFYITFNGNVCEAICNP